MGVLDDILEPPPEGMSRREENRAFWRAVFKIVFWGTAVIFGVPILFIILITLIY